MRRKTRTGAAASERYGPPESVDSRSQSRSSRLLRPRRRLLSWNKIPKWYATNPYIRSGYRPVTSNWTRCFASWLYLHNQSANIYTHLVPAVAAVGAHGFLAAFLSQEYPDSRLVDRAVLHFYLAACTLCFAVSTTYHTLLCHSRELADLWVRLDYAGISVLILASFVPGLYMGFYCEPGLYRSYVALISSIGLLNIYLSFNDRFGDDNWLSTRLIPFVAMGFSAIIPIVHAAFVFPYDQLQKQAGLNFYYLEGVFMVAGVVVLAYRFPERWLPGVFDFWGASHQIFHCLVVFGTVTHFAGIMSGFDWNYTNQRCNLR